MQTLWSERFAQRTHGMRSSAVRELLKLTEQPDVISFGGGLPGPDVFPFERVREATDRVLREQGRQALQYSTTEGYRPLRELIARHTARYGILIQPENVLLTSGSQQALNAATSRGARCNLEKDGSLACRHVVGRDLEFVLRRVAEREVKLDIVRSDPDGDYVIELALLGQCVMVRFGGRTTTPGAGYVYAAVSSRNGLVYHSLREWRLTR